VGPPDSGAALVARGAPLALGSCEQGPDLGGGRSTAAAERPARCRSRGVSWSSRQGTPWR